METSAESFSKSEESAAAATASRSSQTWAMLIQRVYLSDVLNTAARLESMCKQHSAELLITETLNSKPAEVMFTCAGKVICCVHEVKALE